mgnify:CR=1 FL=1
MKIEITLPDQKVARVFPKGTRLLSHEKGWVSWYRIAGNRVDVFTCCEEDFECQNDTSEIALWKDEIRKLAKAIR